MLDGCTGTGTGTVATAVTGAVPSKKILAEVVGARSKGPRTVRQCPAECQQICWHDY